MPYGLPWSEEFVRQLSDKDLRDAFVAEQVRLHIAQLIRALREQPGRAWTQAELGARADKKQNVISRLENPDSPQPSVQTLLEIAAAFDLPLWIDVPGWEEWFRLIDDVPSSGTQRHEFDLNKLVKQAKAAKSGIRTGTIGKITMCGPKNQSGTSMVSDAVVAA